MNVNIPSSSFFWGAPFLMEPLLPLLRLGVEGIPGDKGFKLVLLRNTSIAAVLLLLLFTTATTEAQDQEAKQSNSKTTPGNCGKQDFAINLRVAYAYLIINTGVNEQ